MYKRQALIIALACKPGVESSRRLLAASSIFARRNQATAAIKAIKSRMSAKLPRIRCLIVQFFMWAGFPDVWFFDAVRRRRSGGFIWVLASGHYGRIGKRMPYLSVSLLLTNADKYWGSFAAKSSRAWHLVA